MTEKRFSFLNNISDEESILLSNVLSWAEVANEKHFSKFSFFLDERQQELCKRALASQKLDNYKFWGGFDEATRKVIGLFPNDEKLDADDYPVKSLRFTFRKEDKLTHRNFLGTLMSLQIERKCVGDILVGEGSANVIVVDSVADRVLDEIFKVGGVGVKCAIGFDKSIKAEFKTETINGTVASLRADCLFSLAARLSREKAASLIKMRGISIEHMLTYRPDTRIEQGQSFSVKGFGKFILRSVYGVSKKDRIRVELCKFI